MDTARYKALVKSLTRDEFVAQQHGCYLVLSTKPEALDLGFRTVSVNPLAQQKALFEVIAVKKAPGNPYPDRISLGRAKNCDVVLRDASISKLHAHFLIVSDKIMQLVDDGSHNGTQLNERPLTPAQPVRLDDGDVLQFGAVRATFTHAGSLYDFLTWLGNR